MSATDHLSPAQFQSKHEHGGTLYYETPDSEPRCTGCGHRTTDPITGHEPVSTRDLGPRAWMAELPARARARAQDER